MITHSRTRITIEHLDVPNGHDGISKYTLDFDKVEIQMSRPVAKVDGKLVASPTSTWSIKGEVTRKAADHP